MELFFPGGPLRPVAFGNQIMVNIPGYSGLTSVYVGRIISSAKLQFEVTRP
jgi:hypothetical protein